ncbi:hypothetical protein [Janthinobacterium sp. RT4P48]|uniref:hypothetical protein n=1 Tax=Janthinobacterium sp. RT4P48 TaxID=3424188 RepID=UPI003F2922DD
MQEESKEEVRRILQAAFGSLSLHSKLPSREFYARLNVVGRPGVWVLIYGDYMDFSYAENSSPVPLITEVFAPLQPAEIIDWSPGRSACVQYKAADAEMLSQAIDALIKKLYGLADYKLAGSLETWARA